MSGQEVFSIISGVAVGLNLFLHWMDGEERKWVWAINAIAAFGVGHVVYRGFMCGAV